MRYEDSSQAGAVSGQSDGQGPEARDDLDTLAAGAREPVTGNVISGEGTQFGAASSDLSADDAAVTAVAGAGGKDSSFSGGKLAVTGEYGKLSIDAEGNYSYLANKGAPENVRDLFTYTLADKQGNSDTAALTIEIGKTPVVIRADAQQVVVGQDGVVVLPAGVQLSDIAVVGRNLVVTLPDGSQMVIIDGAVFVPQLVLGTVEVPATNLAALLIDSEPRPAAGTPPPSSGGNFGLPPGPLDPGVPLGDLLPPTEMVYTPPEVRELFDILDRKPDISIDPGNGVPVENAVDSVNEAGLPARNEGEPEGSGEEAAAGANGDPSEATTGTIFFNSPDTPNVITINGVVVTGVVGQVIPGDFGNLVLTSFGNGTIGYTYTLLDNTSGNSTHDDFEVVITDADGDSDTATLTINIVDDVPTARDDTDSIAAGQYGPATGNVITDAAAGDVGDSDTNAADTVGADDASLTSVSGAGGSDSTFNEGGDLVVNGQYGVLTIDADGNYSYVRNQGTPGGVNDVFTYTLTDGDGDQDPATLTISIGDATPRTTPNETALLDDDALANGNPGGVGDDPDGANLSGTLGASGGDGPLTYDLLLTGAPAGFTYVDGPNGSVLVQQGGTTVLTITINAATGAYTVTQNAPIDHAALGDENNALFTINYRVTDQDGDPADGTLNINVDDDTPTIGRADASLPTLTVDETNLALNATGSVAAVFQTSFGADGPGAVTYALAVVNGTDSGLVDVATGLPVLLYNIGGVVTGSTSATLAGVTAGNTVFTASIDANTGVVTLDQIRALDHPSNPNPNDPVSPNASSIQAVATVTDGDGDPVSLAVNIGSSLVFLDDGPSVDITLSAAAEPVLLTQDTETDGTPTTQDSASASFAANFSVNVNNGADGPGTQSVTYALGVSVQGVDSGLNQGGADIFLYLIGGVVVGSTSATAGGVNAGNTVFNVTVDAAGSVTLTQFSQIDHPIAGDPSATGSPFADHILSLADTLVTLTATANVTDGDGDPASDSQLLNIGANLQFADDGPDISAALTGTLLKLDETDGVGVPGEVDPVGGNLGTITVAAASLLTVSNVNLSADTPTTLGYALVLSADGVASGLLLSTTNAPIFLYNIGGVVTGSTSATLAGVNAGNTAFTVSVNSGTGAVTMTQFLAVEHSNTASNDEDSSGLTAGVLGIQVTATDFDGDTDQASVDLGSIIRFEDDGPTIDVSVNGQVSEPVLLTQDTETDGTPTTQDSDSSAVNFGGVFNLAFTTGSDGAATPTLSYALGVSVQGVDSGLNSSGADIFLYLIGGVVVGSTSATAGGVNAGNTVFNVTVSGAGVVTLTQFSQIDHPIAGDPSATGTPFADHILSLTDTMVTLTASSTITDNDGDPASDSATVNIGANLRFADDGPDVAAVLTGTLLKLDETDGVGVPGEVDPVGGNLGTITVAGATLVSVTQPNVSADTPTALAYSLVLSGDGVASGLLVSSNNAPIFLYNIGGVITGSTSATLGGVNAGNTAFTVSVNSSTGAVTMTQFLAIEHPTPGTSYDEDSLGLTAGVLSLRVTATDFDGDTDQASVDLGSIIRFEDDGPTAVNDVDVIVGGNGPATGNVITGVDFVGGDANGTDGSADNIGSDTPGTITFIASNNVPANTDGTYTAGNLVVSGQYGVLTINANGNYSYLRNDGTPGGVNDVFTYTLTDADGDTITATLTIGIDDNFPTLPDPAIVRLDDDALAGGNPGGTGDDVNTAGLPGQLAGTGGDGDLDYAFTGTNTLPAGFTVNAVNASTLQILQGATVVLTITLDTETGAFNVVQNNPIDHLAGDNENNYQFLIGVQVVDADGDTDPANITINVDDDTPTVSANAAVQVDDDALAGGNPGGTGDVNPDTANLTGTLGHSFGADGAGSIAYLTTGAPAGFTYELSGGNLLVKQGTTTVLTLTVNPTTGAYTVVQNNPILHAAGGNENDIAFTINYQVTDGDGDTVNGSLTINSDDDTPVAANDTDTIASGSVGPATGNVITDAAAGDAGDTDTGADSVGADGGAAIVGLASVNVPANVDNNPAGGFVVAGAYGTLTMQADGSYSYLRNDGAGGGQNEVFTYTLTDADGDTTTATLTIAIADALPTLPDPAAVLLDDDALAGGNPGGTGDDINSSGTPGQLLGTGGDGDLDYAFTGTNTLPAGFTVNVVNAGQIQILQGATVVLTVTLTNETGAFTVVQNNPIDHTALLDENNTSFSIGVQVIDVDGDTEPATITINVDDDTPVNFTPVDLTDTTNATVIAQDNALVNDGAALATRLINDANNDGVGENFIGADGFGSLTFTATGHVNGEQLENAGGDPLTSGSLPIYVFGYGTGVLTATTSATNSDPAAVVFTVTLNPNAGFGSASTYTIDFNQTIDNGSGVSFNNLTSTAAGNVDVRGVGADDPLTTVDLLLTASANGANATINTSSSTVGAANQSMNEGETIRIDFVTNLEDDPTDTLATFPSGFSYDGHVGTQSYLQLIPQVQGNQPETVAFRVYALNTTVTDAGSPDDTPGNGFSDSTIVAITHVTVDGYADGADPLNPLQPAVTVALGPVNTWTTIAYGVSARLETDGSVTFSGIQEGDRYGIETGTDFNAVAVSSLAAGIGPVGNLSSTNAFDLGVFSIGVVDTGDPIALAFDVTATDGDGDTSTGTIDVTLVPDTSSSLAITSKSTTQVQESLVAANDDSSLSLSSTDTQKYGAPSIGNTGIVAGIVAASGLMAVPVAAEPMDLGANLYDPLALSADGFGQQTVDRLSIDDFANDNLDLAIDLGGAAIDVSDITSQSHGFDDFNLSDLGLADIPVGGNVQDMAPALAIDQGPSFDFAAIAAFAPAIGMPAAEQLVAAGLTGDAIQRGGSVEQVLADALGSGAAATVDALLQGLPGQEFGGNAGFDSLATPIADHVPAWDMGMAGAFVPGADMMFKMDVAMLHHDAVQPVVNG